MRSVDEGSKDYQAKVVRFPGGGLEVAVSATQHMRRMAQAIRWERHYPIKITMEEKRELTEAERADKAAENRARSVRRARQSIRWLVKCMKADHMVTFSYRENMQDVATLKRDWKDCVRRIQSRYPEWRYVAVRELQERGAYHLHVATHGRQDIKWLRKCWYMTLGAAPDVTGVDTPGQVDVSGPGKRWGGRGYEWKAERLSGYMTKYLHKCFDDAEASSKRYWSSKGLVRPEVLRVWLGATSFVQAIEETYLLVKGECGCVEDMWSSNGWQSIWMSG